MAYVVQNYLEFELNMCVEKLCMAVNWITNKRGEDEKLQV